MAIVNAIFKSELIIGPLTKTNNHKINFPHLNQGSMSHFNFKTSLFLLTIIWPIFFVSLIIWLRFQDPTLLENLAKEDGLFENLQAACYFLCALQAGWAAWCFNLQKKKQPLFFSLVLSAGFILLTLEEISWGQRLFEWETNNFFSQNNYQQEYSLHNLNTFSIFLNHSFLVVGILGSFFSWAPESWRQKLPSNWQFIKTLWPKPQHFLYFSTMAFIYFLYIYPHDYEWGWPWWWIDQMNKSELESAELLLAQASLWLLYDFWYQSCQPPKPISKNFKNNKDK